MVLVALAGVLVPQFQNFAAKSHGVSGATNAAEISKAISLFEATKLRYPSNFCSLVGEGTNAFATSLGTVTAATVADAGSGGSARAATLFNAGIASVTNIDNSAANATFGSETGTQATNGASCNLAFLTTSGVTALGLANDPDGDGDLGNDYVALGLGELSEMVGQGMLNAPVRFPEGAEGTPEQLYARWVVIFQVYGDVDRKAKLVSVAGLDEGLLIGTDKHLEEYFESND